MENELSCARTKHAEGGGAGWYMRNYAMVSYVSSCLEEYLNGSFHGCSPLAQLQRLKQARKVFFSS